MQVRQLLRILFKDKFFAAMNIIGLAVALCCAIFIFLFIATELKYDRFHQDYERIYRVVRDLSGENGNVTPVATTPPILSKLMLNNLPEVESTVKVFPTNRRKTLFHVGAESFYEAGMYDADSSIFSVFTFPFIQGDPVTSLSSPRDIVLTVSTAKRYFGEKDPMGQLIQVEDQYVGHIELTVTGVIDDVPANSHFHFDFLRPAKFMIAPQNHEESWGFAAFHTYIKVRPGTVADQLEKKIQQLVKRVNPEDRNQYHIQSLASIHLHSNLQFEIEPNGDIKNIIILATLGLFILIVACINYINFSLAKSIGRAREVGIRKAAGAWRGKLIRQFLQESLITSIIALSISFLSTAILLPTFNQFTGHHISYLLNGDFRLWSGIILIGSLIGVFSGLYPAFYLSAFSPIKALRGNFFGDKQNAGLRSVLLSIQFIFSVSLIVCTAIITRQLDFIMNADLGYEPEEVIVIPDAYRGINQALLKQQFAQYPEIVGVGASSGMVAENNWHGKMNSSYSEEEIPLVMCNIDTGFLKAMRLKIVELSPVSITDSVGGIVLNETAVKALGYSNPIGEVIYWPRDRRPLKIIGVIKDFHIESFHEKIIPFAFQYSYQFLSNVFIRINTKDIPGTVAKLETAWSKVAPGRPLQYYFLNNHLELKYETEVKLKTLVQWIATIAIVISCFGLLGMTALLVKNKRKEIAIRKVLGASVPGIIGLLIQRISIVTLISIAIALPSIYLLMDKWLGNFAYRFQLNEAPSIFLLPAFVFFLLVSSLTIALSLRAANSNPASVIKSE